MRKLDLKVGYSCNNMCRHCVQGDKRYRLQDKSTEQIVEELREAFSRGIRSVVFTGGEPTIRDDLVDLVARSREIGYEEVQIQTNGRRFSSKKFTKEMVEAGMTNFAPALNGHIPELHDYLSHVPGAWKQTVQGLRNVSQYGGVRITTNTVVSKPNYRFLDKITSLLVALGADQYQLAFAHPAGSSRENFDSIVPFISLAAPHIHRGLQVGLDAGIKVMAEATPLCHMEGYEKCASEIYIPPTDVYEQGCNIKNWEDWRRNEGKWKGEKCKECAYFKICEGPWIEYVEERGSWEFVPVPGDKVSLSDL